MKEQINLLPTAAKRERRARLYRRGFAYLVRRALVALVLVWITVGGVGWIVWQRQQGVESMLMAETGQNGEVFQEVARVNELISLISQRVEAHQPWTPLIGDVVRTLPASARLTVVALQPDTGGLTVRGVSGERATVLEMQRKLEEFPWVERVEAPLQNFAVDAKGEFSFTIFRVSAE